MTVKIKNNKHILTS